jgi:hypothetical protein
LLKTIFTGEILKYFRFSIQFESPFEVLIHKLFSLSSSIQAPGYWPNRSIIEIPLWSPISCVNCNSFIDGGNPDSVFSILYHGSGMFQMAGN